MTNRGIIDGKRKRIGEILVIAGVMIALTLLYYYNLRPAIHKWDYPCHRETIRKFIEDGVNQMLVPHPLYHLFAVLVSNIFPAMTLDQIQARLMALFLSLVFLMVYLLFRRENKMWEALALSLLVCFFTSIPNPITGNYLLGLPHGNLYHNPTYIFMKLFALPQYILMIMCFNETSLKKKQLYAVLSGVLLLISTFSKPNHTIGAVILIAAVYIYDLLKKKNKKLNIHCSLVIVLPSLIALIAQYGFLYLMDTGVQEATDGVRFGLSSLMLLYNDDNVWALILSLIGMFLYPAICLIVFLVKKIKPSFTLKLTYLYAAIQMLIYLFVNETGKRTTDGNFGWGWCFASFLLVLFTTLELKKVEKKWPLILVLVIHAVFGMIYLFRIRNSFI